jgi:hypothetical protein
MPTTMDAEVDAKVLVNGKRPLSIKFYAKIKRINQKVTLSSVFEYADQPIVTVNGEGNGH